MYTSKIVLLVFIFLAVWMTIVNTGNFIYKNDISTSNTIAQAIGIVGIVAYFL